MKVGSVFRLIEDFFHILFDSKEDPSNIEGAEVELNGAAVGRSIEDKKAIMDRRLEEASHAGDVEELKRLLQEDRLLLHRHNTTPYPADNPLHIAASLGHSDFVREILVRNPELARDSNGQGLSALHLASANGHLSVVKELLLLSTVGSDLCLVRDKDGLLPIHTAAMKGRVRVLGELMDACSDSVRALTCLGDSILHLAVKSNCFEAVEFLVERLDHGDNELLKSMDAKGNALLHLATARKQLQTVKLLLAKPWANVNAVNLKGCTVLDVLLESPCEHGDLVLGEMIRAAGGRTAAEGAGAQPLPETSDPVQKDNIVAIPPTNRMSWQGLWRQLLRFFLAVPLKGLDDFKETRNTLMVVATLIATITFQGGLNPPGGFAQMSDGGKVLHPGQAPIAESDKGKGLQPGQALIADQLHKFLAFDMTALFSSLSVILLIICGSPRWKFMMIMLMSITWVAVYFTGLTFLCAIPEVFPGDHTETWINVQFSVLGLTFTTFMAYLILRCCILVHRKVISGCIKRRAQAEERRAADPPIPRLRGIAVRVGYYLTWLCLSVGIILLMYRVIEVHI